MAVALALAGCTTSSVESPTSTSTSTSGSGPSSATVPPLAVPACPSPEIAQIARVADPDLDEISGAALSPTRPDRLWVHEDSGNAPVLTLLDLDGATVGSWTVQGVEAVDWEDLAAVASPPTLFIGDIGDNRAVRRSVTVIRVAEPPPDADPGPVVPEAVIELVLPEPADAEALLIDPTTGDVVVVTKRLSGQAEVLVAPGVAWDDGNEPNALVRAGTLELGALSPVLAGDVAHDGAAVVLRTPSDVLWWPRTDGESIAEALLGRDPCRLPSVLDPFGEAIALSPDGGYLLLGERVGAPIHRAG